MGKAAFPCMFYVTLVERGICMIQKIEGKGLYSQIWGKSNSPKKKKLNKFFILHGFGEPYFPNRFDLESSEARVKYTGAPAFERVEQCICQEQAPLG